MVGGPTTSAGSSSRAGSNTAGCSPSFQEQQLAQSTSRNSLGMQNGARMAEFTSSNSLGKQRDARMAEFTSRNSFGRQSDADVASTSSISGRSSLFDRSRSHSYEDEGSVVRAQAVTDGRAASRVLLPAEEGPAASSSRTVLSR